MTPKAFVFILFSTIASLSFAQSKADEQLTAIERETCLSFPMITPTEQMKKGIHYENESDCVSEDSNGNCRDWSEYVKVKYIYLTVTTTDYYTSQGKLVTTKIDKTKNNDYGIGDTIALASDDVKLKIEKLIFENSETVCKDSYYK